MHMNLDVSGAPHGGSDADIPYKVIDWFEEFEHSRSGLHKQVAYAVLWPLFQLEARRWLSTGTLSVCPHPAVFRDRGFTNEARRRWALAGVDVRNSVILVQGTGSGWDVLMWARLRPKRIIATDLFAFDSWDDVSRHVGAKWNVPCTFHQAPLESHSFLADGSVDVCVSDSVFEHCRDLEGVLAESHRVLRPAGRLYEGTDRYGLPPVAIITQDARAHSTRFTTISCSHHQPSGPTSSVTGSPQRISKTAIAISRWIFSRG